MIQFSNTLYDNYDILLYQLIINDKIYLII